MPTLSNWLVFLGAGLLLNVTPGPDTVYVLARSVAQGRRAGAVSALGIAAGCLVHLSFAVFGLSAILARSAAAYDAIKWAGAAYLVVLGLKTLWRLRRGGSTLALDGAPQAPLGQLFWQGLLTNVLNPKVALFFLAFLPQFVDLSAGHVSAQIALLGATFNLTGTVWLLLIAAASATIGARLRANQRIATWLERGAAMLFIGLGLKLAASARPR